MSTSRFASKAVKERTMRFIASLGNASMEGFMSLDESCQTAVGSLSHVIAQRNNPLAIQTTCVACRKRTRIYNSALARFCASWIVDFRICRKGECDC